MRLIPVRTIDLSMEYINPDQVARVRGASPILGDHKDAVTVIQFVDGFSLPVLDPIDVLVISLPEDSK